MWFLQFQYEETKVHRCKECVCIVCFLSYAESRPKNIISIYIYIYLYLYLCISNMNANWDYWGMMGGERGKRMMGGEQYIHCIYV
jgi:hypothetical protein